MLNTGVRMRARVWVEALERRITMDATAATIALDTTFGNGGYATPVPAQLPFVDAAYSHLTAAPDGKFYTIAYGKGTWPHGYETVDLLRINGDGSRDSSFAEVHIEKRWPVCDSMWGGAKGVD